MSKELPEGCFKFIDHEAILRRDINGDRPSDQRNISVERVIGTGRIVKAKGFSTAFGFLTHYWSVYGITTYELAGDYRDSRYMGGRRWAETDMNGLEWKFYNQADAERWQMAD